MTPNEIVAALRAADPAGRQRAAEEAGRLGEAAAEAGAALCEAAGDPGVADLCVGALEGLGPPPQALLPELTRLVSHTNDLTAYWAATLVGRLGPAAAAALPVLAATVSGSGALSVRERAAWAIGQIGPDGPTRRALEGAAGGAPPRLRRLIDGALENAP